MPEYITNGNLRTRVYDPDEPVEGYKKKTWKAPAEWGPFVVWHEGMTRDTNGNVTPLSLPYVVLHFEKVDQTIRQLQRPVHGYDQAPIPQQPAFNDDDLCAVPV